MAVQRARVDYPEIMRTLGCFIQREHLSEVTITEFDKGWIIAGLTFKSTSQGFIRIPIDFVISYDELQTLSQELTQQRAGARTTQQKRGWLR